MPLAHVLVAALADGVGGRTLTPGGMMGQRFLASRWFFWTVLISSLFTLGLVGAEQAPFLIGGETRGQIFGRDFANTWAGAHLFLAGEVRTLFRPDAYQAALRDIWPSLIATQSFSYPPAILPLIGWLGAFPYPIALAIWTIFGFGGLTLAAWPVSREPIPLTMLLLSPSALLCAGYGQTGLVVAALLLGGLRLTDSRPWLAGVLIGLAAFKPQAGLLIPIALLAAGRWRTFTAAALTTLALVGASLLLAGPESWRLYIAETLPYQGRLYRGTGAWIGMTPSPLVAARSLSLSWATAWTIQIAISLAAAVLVASAFFRLRKGKLIGAAELVLLFAATAVATPYGFNYDLCALTAACLLYVAQRPERNLGVMLFWASPIAAVYVWAFVFAQSKTNIPVAAYPMLVGFACFALSMARTARKVGPTTSAGG